MADTASGQTAGTNEAIGKISVLYGNAKAVSADGMVKVLSVNTPIFALDRVVTEDDGRVTIVLDSDPPEHLDIGRSSDVLIDEDVFGEATPADIAAAAAGADDVREIMLQLDWSLPDAPAESEASNEAGFQSDASVEKTADDVSMDYELTSDDAGKAKVVFYDGEHNEIGSVTFDSVDYDPDLDVNTLLGQIDADDHHGA
ncbi:MAG TPA: hypothetical protein ENN79_04285 [Desulfobacteraceae bacterium]|nr:hypothetical protein [Desulfobacteraceae bacterium]